MALNANDPIIGPSRGNAQGWIDALKPYGVKRRADVEQWIRDVYTINAPDDMPDAFIVVAQALVETGNFTNRWWNERLNAGSLGVTGDDAQNEASPTFKTTMASARAMSAHDLLYATGQINRGGLTSADDPRYSAYREEYGSSAYPLLSDLSGRYAADKQYASTIAGRAADIYGVIESSGEHPLELKPYAIAGTDQKIWSPVPIEVKLVPASHTNQRPGYELRNPHRAVQHETGNPDWGADADMHYDWLNGGANGTQLSFHFVTDDHKIIQLVPVDEVTWQAADGSGPGNYNGISNEMCVNADGDMALARRNAEYLMGGIAAIFDMPDDYMERHYDFNWADPDRHYCPYYMMIQGYWPTFQANANAIKRRYADGSISGDVIPVPTPYTKPTVWPWMNPTDPGFGKDHTVNGTRFFFVPNTYTVMQQADRQAWAAKDSPPSGPPIAVGTQYGGHYVFRSNDDQQTYAPTKNGNRVLARKLLPKVQITKSGTVTVRAHPSDKPVVVRRKGKPVEETT